MSYSTSHFAMSTGLERKTADEMTRIIVATLIWATCQAAAALAEDSVATGQSLPAFIEFGTSKYPWAGNSLCDDPRFRNAEAESDLWT